MARVHTVVLAALASVSSIVGACGTETPCEQAVDKLHSCGHDDAKLTDVGDACQDFANCVADCVLAASCVEIEDDLNGYTSTPLGVCLFPCNRYPHPINSSEPD